MYCEIVFANEYGMCIKAERMPTIKEAEEFYKEESEANGGIIAIYAARSRKYVAPFYDMSNENNWRVFK